MYARAAILSGGCRRWDLGSEFYLNARIVGKFDVDKVRETTPTQIQNLNARLKQLFHNLKKNMSGLRDLAVSGTRIRRKIMQSIESRRPILCQMIQLNLLNVQEHKYSRSRAKICQGRSRSGSSTTGKKRYSKKTDVHLGTRVGIGYSKVEL